MIVLDHIQTNLQHFNLSYQSLSRYITILCKNVKRLCREEPHHPLILWGQDIKSCAAGRALGFATHRDGGGKRPIPAAAAVLDRTSMIVTMLWIVSSHRNIITLCCGSVIQCYRLGASIQYSHVQSQYSQDISFFKVTGVTQVHF